MRCDRSRVECSVFINWTVFRHQALAVLTTQWSFVDSTQIKFNELVRTLKAFLRQEDKLNFIDQIICVINNIVYPFKFVPTRDYASFPTLICAYNYINIL